MYKDFNEIVDSTKNIVLAAIRKNLYPELNEYIDDVAQETYLRAYKSLKKNSIDKQALSTWLYTIARNESIRMNMKHSREVRKQRAMQDFTPEASPENLETRYLISEALTLLKKAIAGLPTKYREVVELDMNGYPDHEIAQKLSLSPGTVKSRNSRGRDIIRRILSQKEPHDTASSIRSTAVTPKKM